MTLAELFKNKKIVSTGLVDKSNLSKKNKSLGLISIGDNEVLSDLIEGLKALPVNFIIVGKGENTNNISFIDDIKGLNISGFDFFVCYDGILNINSLLEKGVTPIVSVDNHMKSLFQEFNSKNHSGNGFIFNVNNSWNIFYAMTRYLENYKFPYDNKALVKNILDI